MRGVIAEAPRHAAAARLDDLHVELRHELQSASDRVHRAERFLVAMAVKHRFLLRQRFEIKSEAPGIELARDELLEKVGVKRELGRFARGMHRNELVAQAEQARGLEPDD